MKIIYYKLVNVIIDALNLVEVIINIVVHHHGVPELIIIDQGA